MSSSNQPILKNTSQYIRRTILEQSMRAHVGHIGSALSIADIIAALYSSILKIPSPENPDRDRFILSKGHAVLAVYAALLAKGWITEEELNTYCGDGSLLGVHPEHALRGIDFSSGSLGQGLGVGAGAALAARLGKSDRRIFVLISDAECNEGSLWESVMFAAHHQLSNLVCILDLNGQQALGHCKDVLNLEDMGGRWRTFGWDVKEIDGHDVENIVATIGKMDTKKGAPHLLIAKTTFGKGVSFMENKIKWHYWPMSEDEYRQALSEQSSQ
jgi:transketolase